jgi:hypothetical protein
MAASGVLFRLTADSGSARRYYLVGGWSPGDEARLHQYHARSRQRHWRLEQGDIKRLLTTGLRPNGAPVAPRMPYGFYRILTPDDLEAIAVYLKTIKPVSNEVPPPVYNAAAYPVPLPGVETSTDDKVPLDPVKRGFYLATLAHCMACHAREPDGEADFKNWWARAVRDEGPAGAVRIGS